MCKRYCVAGYRQAAKLSLDLYVTTDDDSCIAVERLAQNQSLASKVQRYVA